MLAEKYRPKTFGEVIDLPTEIIGYVKNNNVPNFLFSGPQGTGKTTVAKVIVNELGSDCLFLNASDERGIDTVRGKISKFATAKSMNGRRVVILDEVDGTTKDFQQSLRGVMDKYHSNCIFIMTCNFEWQIIDPLKEGRTVHIKFERHKDEDIVKRLILICTKEKYTYEEQALDKLVALTSPDIRRTITQLERIANRDKNRITTKGVDSSSLNTQVLLTLLKGKKLTEAGQLIDKEFSDVDRLMGELSNEFFYGKYTEEQKQKLMCDTLRRAYFEMSRIKNKVVIIRPMLYEIMKVI